jgi:hypothetical protein
MHLVAPKSSQKRPAQPARHPGLEEECTGRLPSGRPIVPKFQRWIPNHPVPSRLTELPANHSQSSLEGIADLLHGLLTAACVEVKCRFRSATSSHPAREARTASSPPNSYFLPSTTWLSSLGKTGVKPCGSPVGILMVFTAGSWNWSNFGVSIHWYSPHKRDAPWIGSGPKDHKLFATERIARLQEWIHQSLPAGT